MKSFVKKVTVLAVAFSMASSTLANAQEEDGKVNFSVQGDLVSSYIWRGFLPDWCQLSTNIIFRRR